MGSAVRYAVTTTIEKGQKQNREKESEMDRQKKADQPYFCLNSIGNK